MRCITVYYDLRKGLEPEFEHREYQAFFDDVDPETTDLMLQQWARSEFESQMRSSDDFPLYGENWIIKEIAETAYHKTLESWK